jgi:hypothetical protein
MASQGMTQEKEAKKNALSIQDYASSLLGF